MAGIYKPGRPFKYIPSSQYGSKPPEKPGIYRIRNGEGQILYIGETCSLCRRIREHIRSGKISLDPAERHYVEFQIADRRSSSQTRRDHERKKIRQHKPLLNKSSGGEGRIAARPRSRQKGSRKKMSASTMTASAAS